MRRGHSIRHGACAAWLAAIVAGCGGDATCIEGVPCGPVPRYDENAPRTVQTSQRFVATGLGNGHSCMLDGAGAAWCWGSNEYGQLGAATTQRCVEGADVPCSSVPVRVGGGLAFAQLTASHRHTCGLTPSGAAWCWGSGLLGDGARTDRAGPVAVAGGHVFGTLATSLWAALTCGLKGDGGLWCWGMGFAYGTTGPAASQVPAPWVEAGAVSWRQFALGEAHACGLDADGRAWCVGDNSFGQLGTGGDAASAVPVPVAGGRTYRRIVVGPSHACALDTEGQAWCWGSGEAAGDGVADSEPRRAPVAVAGGHRFESIAAGQARSCGLTADGTAWCWGNGTSGGLGDGASRQRYAPVAVAGRLTFGTIGVGGSATCGITRDGATHCWGWNEAGAVGVPIVAH